MNSLFGIKIVESPLAVTRVPNRKHRRRAWMSESYHRRIQKKWNKRFGTREEECMLFISPRAAGMPQLGPDMVLVRNLRPFGDNGR